MINLFIFAFICYGISNIIVHGSIFEQFRIFFLEHNPNLLGKLFTCMMCLSFWVGTLVGYLIYSPTLTSFNLSEYAIFMDGFLASGLVWFIHTVQEYFERE